MCVEIFNVNSIQNVFAGSYSMQPIVLVKQCDIRDRRGDSLPTKTYNHRSFFNVTNFFFNGRGAVTWNRDPTVDSKFSRSQTMYNYYCNSNYLNNKFALVIIEIMVYGDNFCVGAKIN